MANAFHRILSQLGEWRLTINVTTCFSISNVDLGALEFTVSEEVFSALSKLCRDKAFGPDDFSIDFWQFYEEGSGKCVFLVGGEGGGGLVPKKRWVEDLKDFRSISLVGELYKLLPKVLACRLKK